MKPCSKNRELITWLVLDHLEEARAVALRRHMESCEGCRHFMEELSGVAAAIKTAEVKTRIVATPAFHRQLTARIKATERLSLAGTVRGILQAASWNWRVVLPVAGVVAALLVVTAPFHDRQAAPRPAQFIASVAPAAKANTVLQPTLSNYQIVANQSLDDLDQLMNEQSTRNLPPAPIFTASTFSTNLRD